MERKNAFSRGRPGRRDAGTAALAALVMLCAVPAIARDAADPPLPRFVHQRWTVEEGLPVNSVNQIAQCPRGYLWLATYDGLVRFDGVRFTVFDTAHAPALRSTRILDLLVTSDAALVILSEQGHVTRYRDGEFHAITAAGGEDVVAMTLHEDAAGVLWVGAQRGLYRYRDGVLVAVAPVALADEGIPTLADDRRGRLWLGTEAGRIAVLENDAPRWLGRVEGDRPVINDILDDREGNVWIAADDGILRHRAGVLEPLATPAHGVSRLSLDGRGAVWLESDRALYRYRDGELAVVARAEHAYGVRKEPTVVGPAGRTWTLFAGRLLLDGREVFRLDDPRGGLNGMVIDHEGTIWLASRIHGLHALRPARVTALSEPEGLSHRNVYPVYQDRAGDVWVGSLTGHVLDRWHDGRFVQLGFAGLSGGGARTLYEDRAGTLWIGTWRGLYRRDGERLVPLGDGLGPGAPIGQVLAIHEDHAGALWVGTARGLYQHRSDVGWRLRNADLGVRQVSVRTIHEARDGSLWLGTNGHGVARYRDGRFLRVTRTQGLASDLVRAIYEDPEGVLWIGTEDRGLSRLDPRPLDHGEPADVRGFDVRHGLFANGIHRILPDGLGYLWMSSNRGLFRLRESDLRALATGEIERVDPFVLTERDGMRNREANGGVESAGIQTRDGRLWFPTQDGLAIIDPHTVARDLEPPPVQIERLLAGGEVVTASAGEITLAPDRRSFDVEYTALSFRAPERMRFRYRLEGYDAGWVDAETRRRATYTKVRPGRYRFRIQARSSDGVWSEEGAALAVTVRPFIYETTFFRVLAGMVLAVVLLAGMVLRERRQGRRERELERQVVARTAALEREKETVSTQARKLTELDRLKSDLYANVSHEFRTPLTLTLGPLRDLAAGRCGPLRPEARQQVDLARRSATQVLDLIDQLLDVAKLDAGRLALRSRRGDLVAFLRVLAERFQPLAERRQLAFEIALPRSTIDVLFDPEQLAKAVGNLLANAMSFTPARGRVRLRVEDDVARGTARIAVADTGPGIPRDALPRLFDRFYQASSTATHNRASTGLGLALARELVELHGGTLRVESVEGEGSTFTIELPLAVAPAVASVEPPAAARETSTGVTLRAIPGVDPTPFPATDPDGVGGGGEEAETDEIEVDLTTVLVVDDHPDVRAYVRRHLARRYRVEEAADGASGLTLARELLPDVVVSDVMMPGLDGHGLCRALKSDPELAYVPVILLTARASTEDKLAGLYQGADDYLTKPFDVRELCARIDNLIASRQRLRERFRADAAAATDAAAVAVVPSSDEAFLRRVHELIETRLADDDFDVAALAAAVALDRSHLYRRLREIARVSPSKLIRERRLERAAALLAARAGSVSEIAYSVGFKSVAHFSKRFRARFGVPPSAWGDRAREAV